MYSMGCACSIIQDCCKDFCVQHGDYALKIRHGNRIGQAECDYKRKVSMNTLAIEQNSLRKPSISSQRRQSINSWYEDPSSISVGKNNELKVPTGRQARRVSIASTEMNETILFDLDEPTVSNKSSSLEKVPDKGILKS